MNNRKILNGFYAMLGLSEQSGDIMRTVDKLDKIGSDKVRVLLVEECGVEEAKADEILTFIAIRGTNGEVLSALEQYRGRNEVFDPGWITTPALSTRRRFLTIPRSARSAPAAGTTISRSIIPTVRCPASASPLV